MYTIILTKSNGYDGITETEYNDIDNYRITDDFLIMEDGRFVLYTKRSNFRIWAKPAGINNELYWKFFETYFSHTKVLLKTYFATK